LPSLTAFSRRLTVSSISSGSTQIIQLDVPRSISVADLKALISAEVPSIPSAAQHLYYNGRLLSDASRTLDDFNMKDDDLVVVHHAPTASSASAGPSRQTAPSPQQQQQRVEGRGSQTGHDSEMIRLQVLGDPRLLQELRNSNPELAEAVNESARFAEAFRNLERKKAEAEGEKQREIVSIFFIANFF
jgi:DNA damage-inducible protein 1